VVAEDKLEELGLEPIAWFHSLGGGGLRPFAAWASARCRRWSACSAHGPWLEDIDLVELNEAFRAAGAGRAQGLGLVGRRQPPRILNVNGSGISLGHPIGATGGRILANLTREMQRRDARYGLETMCIGGGQGIAAVFEKAEPMSIGS
jgi:acetyl-CoA C-acetyltransferase